MWSLYGFRCHNCKVIVESASVSEDSSDDEVSKKLTLQEAHDKLCTEFIKSEKSSYHCVEKRLMR